MKGQTEYSLYVGDLDTSVTDHDLFQYFSSRYESVMAGNVIMDNVTKKSK